MRRSFRALLGSAGPVLGTWAQLPHPEAVEILGAPAPGYSSGDAMAAVEEIATQMPEGVGFSWTGLSYEERLSGSQAPAL